MWDTIQTMNGERGIMNASTAARNAATTEAHRFLTVHHSAFIVRDSRFSIHRSAFIILLLAAVVLGWCARAAIAEEMPTPTPEVPARAGARPLVTVISRVGFDPDLATVKRGCWARMSVLLINDRRSVEGFLQIRRPQDATLIYRQRIDLPLPSRKLWTGYILADDDPTEQLSELQVEY